MARLEYSVVGGIFEQPSGKCFEVGTAAWWEWLESDEAKSFRFETDHGVKSYTARKEVIQNKGYFWYAYKKLDKRLHKSYIGKSPELTLVRLEAVADSLGQSKPTKLHTELGNQEAAELHTGKDLGNQDGSETEELRSRLAELEKENEQLKGRISYLLDERGLAQAKANDDARFEIERLQKLNDELEKENIQLNRVYSQSEDISRKYHLRATEVESQLAEAENKVEMLEQLNKELQASNQALEKQLSECSQQAIAKEIDHSKLRLNKSGEYYQLRGEAVVYVADLKALGYTL